MKNNLIMAALIGSMEQPLETSFQPLLEQQQQLSALPIAPTSGDSNPVTLALATAIKPTESVGSLVAALLQAKNTSEDRKVAVFLPTPDSPARVVMLPTTVSDATALASETLLQTITRDDTTKEVSAHSASGASDASDQGDQIVAAVAAVLEAQKPKRSLASLINAIIDELQDADTYPDASNAEMSITFDQTDDGVLKVYKSGSPGTLTGKVADIQQEEAEEPATATGIW